MAFELIIGPILSFALGAKLTMYMNKKTIKELEHSMEAQIESVNTRLSTTNLRMNSVEETIEVIDKQTLQKMVTTLQPVSTALKEIQAFVGLR